MRSFRAPELRGTQRASGWRSEVRAFGRALPNTARCRCLPPSSDAADASGSASRSRSLDSDDLPAPPPAAPAFLHPEFAAAADSSSSEGDSGARSSGAKPGAGASESVVPDALPLFGADTDWRAFRARLIASTNKEAAAEGATQNADEWAHVVMKPEKGCVLLAHPVMFANSQTYFHQAVIFIIEHSETEGTYGVILNKPTEYKMGDVTGEGALPEFSECRLHLGGDVGKQALQLLHPFNVPGSVQIVRGVHLGGVEAASQLRRQGKAAPEDFKWYTRYAGWGAGQLANEVKRGVWFVAAASPSLVLSKAHTGADLWHTVMQHCGGDFAKLSAQLKEEQAQAKTKKLTPFEQAIEEAKRGLSSSGGASSSASSSEAEGGDKPSGSNA